MLLAIRAVPGTAPRGVARLAGLVALFTAFFAIARPGFAAATIIDDESKLSARATWT